VNFSVTPNSDLKTILYFEIKKKKRIFVKVDMLRNMGPTTSKDFGAFGSGKRLCHSHVRPSVRMYPVEIHWRFIDEILFTPCDSD